MNKVNRKFNSQLKRLERWQEITSMLSQFEGLLGPFDGARPEDIRDLKLIHSWLYDFFRLAKQNLMEV